MGFSHCITFFLSTQFSWRGIHVSLDHLHPLPDPNENGFKSNTAGSLREAEQFLEVSCQTIISVRHSHMDGINDYDIKTQLCTQHGLLVSIHSLDLEPTRCQWSRLEPKHHKSLLDHSLNTEMWRKAFRVWSCSALPKCTWIREEWHQRTKEKEKTFQWNSDTNSTGSWHVKKALKNHWSVWICTHQVVVSFNSGPHWKWNEHKVLQLKRLISQRDSCHCKEVL